MRPDAVVFVAVAQVNSACLPGPDILLRFTLVPLEIVELGHAGLIRVNPALAFSVMSDKSPFKRPLFLPPRRNITRFPALIVFLDEDLRGAHHSLAACYTSYSIVSICAVRLSRFAIDDEEYVWQDRRRRHASAADGSRKLVTIGSPTDSPLSVKNDVSNTADRSLSVALLYSLPGSQFSSNNNVSSV
jgi:hypothetical protein